MLLYCFSHHLSVHGSTTFLFLFILTVKSCLSSQRMCVGVLSVHTVSLRPFQVLWCCYSSHGYEMCAVLQESLPRRDYIVKLTSPELYWATINANTMCDRRRCSQPLLWRHYLQLHEVMWRFIYCTVSLLSVVRATRHTDVAHFSFNITCDILLLMLVAIVRWGCQK